MVVDYRSLILKKEMPKTSFRERLYVTHSKISSAPLSRGVK